jgi:hypothetical protein
MAALTAKLGSTLSAIVQVTSRARLQASVQSPLVYETPQGLNPLRLTIYEVDEYRILSGWPVAVPAQSVHATTEFIASGSSTEIRPDPVDIKTDAHSRWIASTEFYDTSTYRWNNVNPESGLFWQTSAEYAPAVLTEYEYRVGDERFKMEALNFDSDSKQHLWMDLESVAPYGYTVIMVMSPNSVYTNDADVPYNGIWTTGSATPPATTTWSETRSKWWDLEIQGYYLYLDTWQTRRTKALPLANHLESKAPLYLAFNTERPKSKIWVGEGPMSIRKMSVPAGKDLRVLDDGVVLGRTTGSTLNTADMVLLDLGVYTGQLSDDEVRTEISKLAQAYGGGDNG